MPTNRTDLFHAAQCALAAGAQHIGRGVELGLRNADRFVLAELEHEPTQIVDGARWIDIRPLTDEREHPPQIIDIWRDALDYALWRGIVQPHAQSAHLVRIVTRKEA